MTDENTVERLIASLANGEAVDWDVAGRRATTDAERVRIQALRGVEQIATFSRAQWQHLSARLDVARTMDAPTVEAWLGGLDPEESAELRRLLSAHPASTDASFSGEVRAGDTVGAYALETQIGEGGMGTVWRARRGDGRFEGYVAVKLLHLPLVDRHGRGRFHREGQILARLRHPHIAQLIDAGVTDHGQPYLVLEHVDGVAIDRYCDERRLDVRTRIELFLDVLRAVAHAHTSLVLHRDLKPSNILVDRTGQAKLLDFGVAKLLEDETGPTPETELTQHAGGAFTPEYAAPEQLLGQPVTTATDVYATGVVLYALLTGCHPTGGVPGTPLERMRAILNTEPKLASDAVAKPAWAGSSGSQEPDARDPTVMRRRRDLKGDLDNILAKALKKAPEERYPGAAAFADDLRRHLNQRPVTARADTIRYRVGKFVQRHRGAVAGTSIAAVALIAATIFAITQMFEARRQRDEAQEQTQRANAFSNVVTSLLSQVGPGGRALTPEELLDRAVEEMEARYADEPKFLVSMLIRISGRYFDLRNTKKELATLVKAEQVARRAGDPSLIFDVQTNTVETELALGRKTEARKRIEEARRLLPSLKNTPLLDDYLRAEAELARANDDLPAAIEYLERARRVLEDEGRTQGNSYPGILSTLMLCHSLLGNARQAHELALEIVEIDKRLGRERTAGGISARTSLATSYGNLGEVQRARAAFEDAVPELKQPSADNPPSVMFRYGEVLSRLGHHDEALRLIRSAIVALDRGGHQTYAIRARLNGVRALLRAQRTAEAYRALDEVVDIMMTDQAANHTQLGDAGRLRGEAHLAAGRLDEAARETHVALERYGYPANPRGIGVAPALLALARIQLAQRQPTQALESALAALQIFEQNSLDPALSANVGEARLVLAQVQLGAGDAAGARASLVRAIESLRNGLGADHALTREAERLSRPPR